RLNSLWNSIACMIYRGGYFFSDFEILKDMAFKGTTYVSPFFGSEVVPENHLGKVLARKHFGPAAEVGTVCAPLGIWKEDFFDEGKREEFRKYMWAYNEMVLEGHKEEWEGLMSLTAVVMNEWKLRTEGKGEERMELVGCLELYKDIVDSLMEEWQGDVGGWIKGGAHRKEVMLGPSYSGK